ncbi:DUF1294 domain-containing protein [uncultured Methanomethylovorans sp.]|uniref:DUF1294 domain-containing protein n=1 Tax=uncultured Methanomethylovorans sp. TaxID=183759 RepID=UPI002AA6DBEF|nr:DUF1294 domain-containing protein [uncultured Methanomethylovorans sp.]
MQSGYFLTNYLLVYVLVVNIISFSLMGLDKKKATRKKYRIPEKQLFLWVIMGGSLGGVLGMKIFRHKTKHPQFKYGFPLILLIHLVLISMFWTGILSGL